MAANCNYKVGVIGAFDMLKFKNMPKMREQAIQSFPATPLPKTLTTNEKAKERHPAKQEVVISEIRQNGSDAKTIVFKTEDGKDRMVCDRFFLVDRNGKKYKGE